MLDPLDSRRGRVQRSVMIPPSTNASASNRIANSKHHISATYYSCNIESRNINLERGYQVQIRWENTVYKTRT